MLIKLPTEVLLRILRLCDPDELAFSVAHTCRHLNLVCGDNGLWRCVLGLEFFHNLGLGRADIGFISDIRAWYIAFCAQKAQSHTALENFITTQDPADALLITRAGLASNIPLVINLEPKTLKHVFWGHWFSDIIIKLRGLSLLYSSETTWDDPLNACVAASMAAGHLKLRSACLEVVDDAIWSTDAFFMTPLERIDLMISKIDTALYSCSMMIKAAVFVHLATRYNLLSATLVSIGSRAQADRATFACVFLGEDQQCFIDYGRQHGIVRSTEDMQGRIQFMGASNNIRAGLMFEDILSTEPKIFSTHNQRHKGPLHPKLLPQLLKDVYLGDDGARRYRNLFAGLCMQAMGIPDSPLPVGPLSAGNYQDLSGRLCTVYNSVCVVLEAHEQVCLVLDRYRLLRVPPNLLMPARPIDVFTHPVYKLTLPAIDQLDIEVLGQYFERWGEDRFV